MEKSLHVVIVSPERIVFDGKAVSVQVPGEKGRFEVLYNHADIISSLVNGTVKVEGESKLEFNIAGGFIDVKANEVSLCVELN